MVAQKAGIPADKAQQAVTTVLGFIKTKLPAPIAAQVESALSGDMSGLGDMAKHLPGGLGDALGGLLGGDKK